MTLSRPLSRISRLLLLAPCLMMAWSAPLHANVILDYQYSGIVTSVDDPYGVFGAIAPGSSVSGLLRLSNPTPSPDIVRPGQANYDFPVTPDGRNLLSTAVGSLNAQSTQNLLVQVYGPPTGSTGIDFQFSDAETSSLNLSQLPAGYSVSLGSYVGFFTTDVAQSTFPDLPSALLPLSQYNARSTGGFLFVDIRDATGEFISTAYVDFQITTLTAVPEPSSGLMAMLGFGLVGACSLRRRAAELLSCAHRRT